jgi:hypothetical protein
MSGIPDIFYCQRRTNIVGNTGISKISTGIPRRNFIKIKTVNVL